MKQTNKTNVIKSKVEVQTVTGHAKEKARDHNLKRLTSGTPEENISCSVCGMGWWVDEIQLKVEFINWSIDSLNQ